MSVFFSFHAWYFSYLFHEHDDNIFMLGIFNQKDSKNTKHDMKKIQKYGDKGRVKKNSLMC